MIVKLKDIINKLWVSRIRIVKSDKSTEDFVAYKIDINNEETIFKQEYNYDIDLVERYGAYEIIAITLENNVLTIGILKD